MIAVIVTVSEATAVYSPFWQVLDMLRQQDLPPTTSHDTTKNNSDNHNSNNRNDNFNKTDLLVMMTTSAIGNKE